MTRGEHLLTILSEECAEVIQRVDKALRFGPNEKEPGQELTNSKRINEELCHVIAASEMLEIQSNMTQGEAIRIVKEKKEKVEKYLKYSKEIGTLS